MAAKREPALPDTEDNIKFVYLFVKSFKWHQPADIEATAGHPKAGRVYQAVLNTDTNTYRLVYNDPVNDTAAVYLAKLVIDSEEEPQYKTDSEIVEITLGNILDFNILEEDLDKLLGWRKDNNLKLKQQLGLNKKEKQVSQQINPVQAVAAVQKQADDQDLQRLGNSVINIRTNNPLLYEAVSDLVFYIEQAERASGKNMIDASWMDFSKTLGAGKNISRAIERLAVYGGEDRRSNLMTADLLEAGRSLLLEGARKKIQGIE